MATQTSQQLNVRQIVNDILGTIEKDREREIITRRFGLNGRKETLEEIGDLLGITRERVRQIEKQAVIKLSELKHPHFDHIKEVFSQHLEELGRVAPLSELAERLGVEDQSGHAQVSFLARLVPEFEVIYDNDYFRHSVALKSHHDSQRLHELAQELVDTIRSIGKPVSIDQIKAKVPSGLDEQHVHGLARSTKSVTSLEGKWGLVSWPLVNPT